ncbi:hypothetical protein [Malikia sp.]|uniref:hypothetical protein n=1 Tax=Malikia sp. TaxID=2070706 RepID=UPI00261D8BDD|nr:hypothetical protein [Malikia sp.]MDD2728816.1 hypothetical protein [Malikia sp.]
MVLGFSPVQYEALGRSSYLDRLVALIRSRFPRPAEAMDDEALAQALWEETELARSYGLEDEQSAATFALTAWLLGRGFDHRIPALAQILNSDELSPGRKAQALRDFTLLLFSTLEGQPTRKTEEMP